VKLSGHFHGLTAGRCKQEKNLFFHTGFYSFFNFFFVWGEIESTWYVGHYLAYCVEQSME
jgi:hypothetical protein